MNLPNKLTVVRIVLAPLFLILALVDFPFHYLVAGLVFGIAALTDMLDGKIARSRGLITNLGKFLDPLADKMLTTAAFLVFAKTENINWWIWALMIILTREFMVTSVRLVAAKDGTVIAANFWGKLKTVTQFGAIIYELAALELSEWLVRFEVPALFYQIPLGIGTALLWISVVLTAVSGVQYVWANRKFFKESK